MKNAAQTRVLAVLLALATIGVCVLAAMNFDHESGLGVPTDGIWWVEAKGGLRAERVRWIHPGIAREYERATFWSVLTTSQRLESHRSAGRCTARASGVMPPIPSCGRFLSRTDLNGAPRLDIQVFLGEKDRSINQGLRFIALVYLSIGIYVLFRRWTAPKSIHFYVFCLASFVLYSFRSTGELGIYDWGNMVAQALQPALFLHFALSFSDNFASEDRDRFRRTFLYVLLYLPGIFLLGLQYTAIRYWSATEVLLHRLDQISLGYLALYYVIAAVVFRYRYRHAESALERQQLKWLTRGTLLVLNVIPYLADWSVAESVDQARRAVAGDSAADIQLGNRPLPPDGCGPDLQARRDLYAGDGVAGWPLFRRYRVDG